jgi:hypothetical protein
LTNLMKTIQSQRYLLPVRYAERPGAGLFFPEISFLSPYLRVAASPRLSIGYPLPALSGVEGLKVFLDLKEMEVSTCSLVCGNSR